jgi:Fe-S-cluster containining protein
VLEGWRIAGDEDLPLLVPSLPAGVVALTAASEFDFDCRAGGAVECCGHADTCGHARRHAVGSIVWTHANGRFQCPHLTAGNACGIHTTRPITCRLFPLGANIFPAIRTVVVWRAPEVGRTCPGCHGGRTWTVRAWLEAMAFWPRLAAEADAIARGRRHV